MPETLEASRERAVALASAVVTGEMDLLEAAPALAAALNALGCTWDDQAYKAFGLIASETDALPIGEQCKFWSAEALARMEPELERARSWAAAIGEPACQEVLERFGRSPDTPREENAV